MLSVDAASATARQQISTTNSTSTTSGSKPLPQHATTNDGRNSSSGNNNILDEAEQRSKIDKLTSIDYPMDWDQLLQPSSTNSNNISSSTISISIQASAAALLRSRIELRLYAHETLYLQSLKQMYELADDEYDDALHAQILHNLLHAAHLRLLLNDFLKSLKAYERFYSLLRKFRTLSPSDDGAIGQFLQRDETNVLRNFFYGIAVCYDELNLGHLAREAYNLALQKNVSDSADAAAFVQTVHYRLALLYQDAGLEKLSRKHLMWLRRLVLASNSSTDSTVSILYVLRIDFQLGKLYEKCAKIEQAKKMYEEILQKMHATTTGKAAGVGNSSALSIFRACVLKQLGWLVFMHAEFGALLQQRAQLALTCLKQSVDLNEDDGQTWYFIGRCYSALGHVRDAYAAYKNSIDKSDANADTWCSIGILYQQQKQQVDALQAYVCAVQLDDSHHFAWLNLGMLYESVRQYRDACHCFRKCLETLSENEMASSTTAATASSSTGVNLKSWCQQRIEIFEKLLIHQPPEIAGAGDAAAAPILTHVEQALTTHMPFAAEMMNNTMQNGDSAKRRRALLEADVPMSKLPPSLFQPLPPEMLVDEQQHAAHLQAQFDLQELRDAIRVTFEQREQAAREVQEQDDLYTKKLQQQRTKRGLTPLESVDSSAAVVATTAATTYAQVEAQTLFNDLERAITANFNEFETAEELLKRVRQRYSDTNNSSKSSATIVENKRDLSNKQQPSQKVSSGLSNDAMDVDADKQNPSNEIIDDADDLRANLCYNPIDIVRQTLLFPPGAERRKMLWPDLDAYLLPTVARKSVDTRRDAMSIELERFCMAHPVVIVRNICTALKLDMSLFSTKTIVDRDPQYQAEVRVQRKEPLDQKRPGGWFVSSRTTYLTLRAYGEYQASLFAKTLAEEPTATTASGGAASKQRSGGAATTNSSSTAAALPPPPAVASAAAATPHKRQSQKQKDAAAAASAAAAAASSSGNDAEASAVGTAAKTAAAGRKKARRGSAATATAASGAAPSSILPSSSTMSLGGGDDESCSQISAETTATSSSLQRAGGVQAVAASSSNAKKFEQILFCTNCDLSDMDKWSLQLAELQKLPRFLRVESASNMLTHLDHKVLGVNTPQLFMKVPGCRTTGHQQPLMFCSVNINIGPGECEWFCVPNEYWPRLRALCQANNVDYVHGSWWPDPEQLRQARIPVYRLTQLPGDLVWINPGTIQWVYASGWNNNVAWNVAPFDARQLALALERYEWNKQQNLKSLVPLQSLVWSLARNVSIREPLLYRQLKFAMQKCLVQSECVLQRLQRYKLKQQQVIEQQREEGEPAYYCEACECELFNVMLVKEDKTLKKFLPHCLQCALAEEGSNNGSLISYLAIQQHSQKSLSDWYDGFQFAC